MLSRVDEDFTNVVRMFPKRCVMPTLLLTPSVMCEGKSNRWREMLWPWIGLPALMEADLGMTEMGDPVCR